ncbi:MAG TPA: hypothetical protein VGW34_06595 [Allosphingosinicella sp.]|nr:hypothetical protein [Allosphingosinicella sp.]
MLPTAFKDRLNSLDSARDAALKRLLRTPAPDLPALALKIELAVDEEVATLAAACWNSPYWISTPQS